MSKRLPPNANLAHLKKQAKDLQKAHRAGDDQACTRLKANLPRLTKWSAAAIRSAELSLQEAQHVIGREYGFANWSALLKVVQPLADADLQADQLKKAINTGDVEGVKSLLATTPGLAKMDLWTNRWGRPWSALTYAAGDNAEGPNQIEIIKLLLEAGADLHDDSPERLSAFSRACTQGNLPVMEVLVEYGLNVKTFQGGQTIMGPCESLNPDAIRFLLAHGAEPNFTTSNMGSPLDLVICTYAHEKRNECLEALIQGGVEYEDGAEMDILRSRIDLLEKRLDEQPDLVHSHSTFRQGDVFEGEFGGVYGGAVLHRSTLLHLCAEFNEVEAAQLLLARGADVNARAVPDDQGVGNQTAIYHTVTSNYNKSFPMLELLLAHGADLSIPSNLRVPRQEGRAANATDPLLLEVTPLEYALQYPNDYQPGPGSGTGKGLDTKPHENVIELLQKSGGERRDI